MRHLLVLCVFFHIAVLSSAQETRIDVLIDNPQPYVGQRIVYSIRVISTEDLSTAQIDLPQFVRFTQYTTAPSITVETINGLPHNVLQQDVFLSATQPDQLTISPTIVTIPLTVFQPELILESSPLTIDVLPLPSNAPETFNNAVGQFAITAEIQETVIQAGDPNSIFITITGVGNFEQITTIPYRLPETWQTFVNIVRRDDTRPLTSKTFKIQFFPEVPGEQTVPSNIFTYFDPIEAVYKTITTDPLRFTVEGEFSSTTQIQRNNINQLPLKSMIDTPDSNTLSAQFWLIWLIAPAIAIAVILFQKVGRRTSQGTRTSYKTTQLNYVMSQFKATRDQSPNQIYATVASTCYHYLSQRYQTNIASIKQAQSHVKTLPEHIQRRIILCLQQAEDGQYAPVSSADARKLMRETYNTIQQIESIKR